MKGSLLFGPLGNVAAFTHCQMTTPYLLPLSLTNRTLLGGGGSDKCVWLKVHVFPASFFLRVACDAVLINEI